MITERKTFPEFPDDVYGQMRKNDLNLLLSAEERENVLTIIEQVVELSPQQRTDFSMIIKKTSLENIIDTIKFIEDRYKVIELLKSIVYDLTKFANERDHVQKIVERHFFVQYSKYRNDI